MANTIPNWTFFGVHLATVSLIKNEIPNEGTFYNAVVNVSLNDGENVEFDSVVSLITDNWDADPVECALQTVTTINELFTTSTFIVIQDSELNDIGEFILDKDGFNEDTDITWYDIELDEETVDDNDSSIFIEKSAKIILH